MSNKTRKLDKNNNSVLADERNELSYDKSPLAVRNTHSKPIAAKKDGNVTTLVENPSNSNARTKKRETPSVVKKMLNKTNLKNREVQNAKTVGPIINREKIDVPTAVTSFYMALRTRSEDPKVVEQRQKFKEKLEAKKEQRKRERDAKKVAETEKHIKNEGVK